MDESEAVAAPSAAAVVEAVVIVVAAAMTVVVETVDSAAEPLDGRCASCCLLQRVHRSPC